MHLSRCSSQSLGSKNHGLGWRKPKMEIQNVSSSPKCAGCVCAKHVNWLTSNAEMNTSPWRRFSVHLPHETIYFRKTNRRNRMENNTNECITLAIIYCFSQSVSDFIIPKHSSIGYFHLKYTFNRLRSLFHPFPFYSRKENCFLYYFRNFESIQTAPE